MTIASPYGRNRSLAKAYIDYLENVRHRSALTAYQYGQKLESFCLHLGDLPVSRASVGNLEKWLTRDRSRRIDGRPSRATSGAGKAATISRDTTVLRGFFAWLRSHGHIEVDPAAELVAPTVKNLNPRAIDDKTWRRVWFADALTPQERLVLGLGYFCGLRRVEICGLRPSQVDLKRKVLTGFNRKGAIDGNFPYGSAVSVFAERLPHLLGTPRTFLGGFEAIVHERSSAEYLLDWGEFALRGRTRSGGFKRRQTQAGGWGAMTNPDQVNQRLGRMLARMKMPGAFTPHALRHSFVTKLLEAGIPLQVVSRLAAHSSVEVTMRYVRLAEDPLARFLNSNEDRIRPRWQ